MGRLEKSVSKDVRTVLTNLELAGAVLWWERLNSGKVKSNYGHYIQLCRQNTPDYVAVLPVGQGVMIYFIETKSDSGKQTAGQIAFQKQVESWGGIYQVVREAGEVKTTVESITNFWQEKISNITLDI